MKSVSIILSLILVLSLFTGCGSTSSVTAEQTVKTADVQISAAESEAEVQSGVLDTELFTDEDAFPINLDEEDGDVSITAPGNYVLSGKLEGTVIVNTANEGKVKLILNGVTIECEDKPCIYVKNADKVVVSSAAGSVNSLTTSGEFVYDDDNNADAVIFSQDDLNLNGEGVINIKSTYGHGVVSKDELKIKDGTVNISAYKKGVSGKDALTIEGGTLDITARTHALYSEGDVTVSGGTITASSTTKDGIHTTGNVNITDGNIVILESVEGIEGLTVTVSGGYVYINASDDGINASSGDSSESMVIGGNPFIADDGADITINGGIICVNASGDGVDSNGTLNMTGGELYVSGPTASDNAAIDYATEAIISGGSVIATGPSAMAEGFSQNSTQCNILYNCNTTYDAMTVVSLFDPDGNEIISYTPEKQFSSVVISSPEIEQGKTYTLVIGEDSTEITMDSVCYSTGGMGMNMMPGGGAGFEPGGQRPGQGENREPGDPMHGGDMRPVQRGGNMIFQE